MNFLETAGLFTDCWHLYRKYYSKDLSDDTCKQFVDEIDLIYEKYKGQEFAKDIILAVIKEIEKTDKVRIGAKKKKEESDVSRKIKR